MPELIVRSGKHEGKTLNLPDHEVTVGRDEDCQIRLATNDVSRKHCIIRPTPAGLVLQDLGSRNGTLVNDVRVEGEQLLVPGDTVRIGPVVLEVPGEKTAPPADDDLDITAADNSDEASADEIASWLMEEEDDINSGTTTIIKGTAGDAPAQEGSGEIASVKSDPNKKKFRSVAEEAAFIIESWQELDAEEVEQAE